MGARANESARAAAEPVPVSYAAELDRLSRSLLPIAAVACMLVWIPFYLLVDPMLHPRVRLLFPLRFALGLIAVAILALYWLGPLRNRARLGLGALALALALLTAAITAATDGDPVYLSGYCLVLLTLLIAPLSLRTMLGIVASANLLLAGRLAAEGWFSRSTVEPHSLYTWAVSVATVVTFAWAADRMRHASWKARLLAQQLAEERARDLNAARRLQRSLIPIGDREYGAFQASVVYRPLTEVGGDFCDATLLPDGRLRLFIADAIGHGVEAALFTMAIKTEYEDLKRSAATPAEILRGLNAAFQRKYDGAHSCFTSIVCDLSPEGALVYASGGHPDQLLLGRSGLQRLARTGPIIGAFPERHWDNRRTPLDPEFQLWLFTDGAFEVFSRSGEMFGEEAFARALLASAAPGPAERLAEALAAVDAHRGSAAPADDVTALAASFRVLH